MKKLFAVSSIFLAVAMPAAFAQSPSPTAAPAPVAMAAPDAATLAAANEMLDSMNYRTVMQGMMGQMRQAMPAMMKQGAVAAIDGSAKLDAAQKKQALDKLDQELPRMKAFMDGVFDDPAVMNELVQEAAGLYARHFSVNELHQIAMFYKTPVGAKTLNVMPQIMQESMQISQRVIMPRVGAIMKKLEAQQTAP
jgi:hypothetical protein